MEGGVWSQDTRNIYLTPAFTEVEKYVNESHIVSCRSEQGISMMWTKEKEQITAAKGRIHVEQAPGGKGIALFFENIGFKDRGNYTCSATVDGKQVHMGFRLVVIKPIKFLDTSPVQVANESESVVMRCEVEGEPEPTISWTAKGRQPDGKKFKVVADGLAIKNVTLHDQGDYHCRAFQLSNDKSNIIERTISLKVQHKPVFNGTDKAYGYVTGVVNLTCEVSAEPLPKFEWKKGDKALKPKENITIIDDKLRSTLKLRVVDESVFGNYTCKASNTLGKMERKISLQKGTKPDKPEVSVFGSTPESISIKIEGPEDDELKILGYKVQYLKKDEAGSGWAVAKETEFTKSETPYIIPGLVQNTEYIVRVAARNAAGYSDYTDETSASTDKVHADQVTGTSGSSDILSSKSSQLFVIVVLHNIFFQQYL